MYCTAQRQATHSSPVFSYEFSFDGTANVFKKLAGGTGFPGETDHRISYLRRISLLDTHGVFRLQVTAYHNMTDFFILRLVADSWNLTQDVFNTGLVGLPLDNHPVPVRFQPSPVIVKMKIIIVSIMTITHQKTWFEVTPARRTTNTLKRSVAKMRHFEVTYDNINATKICLYLRN